MSPFFNDPSPPAGTANPPVAATAFVPALPSGPARYRDRYELGRGACGVVVAARDEQLGRPVAIKRIARDASADPERRERFVREAKLTASLQHPGVVPIHEAGCGADGTWFYAMKWLEGETLADRIASRRRTARRRSAVDFELLERFLDVCDTIAFAHGQSIIHRDLKPQNVMVGPCGETVVVDWGLAKRIGPEAEAPSDSTLEALTLGGPPMSQGSGPTSAGRSKVDSKTRQGTVAGTPGFMAPEQARGEIDRLGPPTDVFSLGVILFEILTGASPFASASSSRERIARTAAGCWPDPLEVCRGVCRPLASICRKAMSEDPARRYADAGELADDLRRFMSDAPVSAHRESCWERGRRWCRRHNRLATAALVSVVAVSLVSTAGAVLIHRAHRAEQAAHAEARAALEAESAARREAEAAHARALHRFEMARAAADAWLMDLSDSLEHYPGLRGLHDDLLDRAEATYQSLLETAEPRPRTPHDAVERSRCLTRLGLAKLRLGKHAEAETCLRRAVNIAASLRREQTAITMDPRIAILAAETGLANVSLANGNADATRRASEQLRSAYQNCVAGDFAGSASSSRASRTITRARITLARLAHRRGEDRRAVQHWIAARTSAESLIASGGSAGDQQRLETVLEGLAHAYRRDGRLSASIHTWSDLIRLYESRLESRRQRPDWIRGRAMAHSQLASNQRLQGDTLGAKHHFHQAVVGLRQGWERIYGDFLHSETVAEAHANLGSLAHDVGDFSQAEASYGEAVGEIKALIRSDGETPSRVQWLASFRAGLGRALSVRDPRGGTPMLLRAESELAAAETAAVQTNIGLSSLLSLLQTHLDLALLHAWGEDFHHSKRHLAAARDCCGRLSASSVEASQQRRLELRVLDAEARVLRRLGDLNGAAEAIDNLVRKAPATAGPGTESAAIKPGGAFGDGLGYAAARLVLFLPDASRCDPAAALDWLDQFETRWPLATTQPSWWRLRGVALFQLGRIEQASAAIRRAKSLSPAQFPIDPILELEMKAAGDAGATRPLEIPPGESVRRAAENALREFPGEPLLRAWCLLRGLE